MLLKRYSYDTINHIKRTSNQNLEDDIINIINFISHKVGAPSYKKTPNFKKKTSVADKITGEDWAAIRNFKSTVLEKNTDGIALMMDEIRSLLNKITNDTYETLECEILEKMEKDKDKFKYDEFMKIGKLVFEIGSLNKYCSELYAKLYKKLLTMYPIFEEISNKNYDMFLDIFNNIKVVNPEEDYNLYCDNNKMNENRKCLSIFYVNLMKHGVFKEEKIVKIILLLIEKVESNITEENKSPIVEEIVNNLIILIEKTYETIKNNSNFEVIENHIERMSIASKRDFVSLSSKIKFKYMDLTELLED